MVVISAEVFRRGVSKIDECGEDEDLELARHCQSFQVVNKASDSPEEGLYITPMSRVVAEPVRWLWLNRIPLGKLTILDGDPGSGKSSLSLDLAARVSRGAEMPDGSPSQCGEVILIGGEDSLADTVLPRLNAAGANLDRIQSVVCNADRRAITLPKDTEAIRDLILATQAVLVVIDPFLAFVGANHDTYVDRDVRDILNSLSEIAVETGAAFLLIRHRRKSPTGNPLHDGLGSIGIIAACRSGLLLATNPSSSTGRVLAVTKQNLVRIPNSLAFHFAETSFGAPTLVWDGPSTYTAADLSNPYLTSNKSESALQEAIEFLEETLANGQRPAAEILELAKALEISEATLQRAKKQVADSQKTGLQGPWCWKLKETPSQP